MCHSSDFAAAVPSTKGPLTFDPRSLMMDMPTTNVCVHEHITQDMGCQTGLCINCNPSVTPLGGRCRYNENGLGIINSLVCH